MPTTYVLVHGAWMGKFSWDDVVPRLTALGHTVVAVELPGHGEDNSPLAEQTLANYRDTVIKAVEAQNEPVVLVGHSMGGMVISEVAEAVPDRINTLVYVAGYLPQNGDTLLALAGQDKGSLITAEGAAPTLLFAPDYSTSTIAESAIVPVFCADCDSQHAQFLIEKHKPEAGAPFGAAATLTEQNFGKVRKVYIETLQDKAVSHQLQQLMLAKTPADKTLTLDSSHSPFFSMPAALAAHLTNLD